MATFNSARTGRKRPKGLSSGQKTLDAFIGVKSSGDDKLSSPSRADGSPPTYHVETRVEAQTGDVAVSESIPKRLCSGIGEIRSLTVSDMNAAAVEDVQTCKAETGDAEEKRKREGGTEERSDTVAPQKKRKKAGGKKKVKKKMRHGKCGNVASSSSQGEDNPPAMYDGMAANPEMLPVSSDFLEEMSKKHAARREKLSTHHEKDLDRLLGRYEKFDEYGHFLQPVSEEQDPFYKDAVKNPMDLRTVREQLAAGKYSTPRDGGGRSIAWHAFESDVLLICDNAMEYNPPSTICGDVHREAKRLRSLICQTIRGSNDGSITGRMQKHEKDWLELESEEELDKLQAANKEPAVQGEWRKTPYPIRSFTSIASAIATLQLPKEMRGDEVERTLRTRTSGFSPLIPEQTRRRALKWLRPRTDNPDEYELVNPKGCVLGENITIRDVWGIDCHTRKSVQTAVLEAKRMGTAAKHGDVCDDADFICRWLLPFINKQPSELAWDMRNSLRSICDYCQSSDATEKFSASYLAEVEKAARTVLEKYRLWGENAMHNFRIHPKGRGVVCTAADGIPSDSFVAEYAGEVYPAWRWCERQNALDSLQMQCSGGKITALPDFWNMQLERHKDDPDGLGILTVDPSNNANFASRLSHSCTPNCQTMCIAVNGRYMIAMHTVRDVHQGEELTIDYNAVTSSKEEFQLATCLCGSTKCRGSFLYLTRTGILDKYMTEKHTSLHRFAGLVQACMDPAARRKALISELAEDESQAVQKATDEADEATEVALDNFRQQELPKRPLSSYFIFVKEYRPQLLRMRPELEGKVTEVAQTLAGQWRAVAAIAAPVADVSGAEKGITGTQDISGDADNFMESGPRDTIGDEERGETAAQDSLPKLFLFKESDALRVKEKCDQRVRTPARSVRSEYG